MSWWKPVAAKPPHNPVSLIRTLRSEPEALLRALPTREIVEQVEEGHSDPEPLDGVLADDDYYPLQITDEEARAGFKAAIVDSPVSFFAAVMARSPDDRRGAASVGGGEVRSQVWAVTLQLPQGMRAVKARSPLDGVIHYIITAPLRRGPVEDSARSVGELLRRFPRE